MAVFKSLWECMLGPRLIRIYGAGSVENFYQQNHLEKWGDQVVHSLYVIWKISVYASPFLVGILYQKGYLCEEGWTPLSKFMTSIGVILVISYCCKGLGRYNNATYMSFLNTLNAAKQKMTPEIKQNLSHYDFDFHSWPIEFNMRNFSRDASKYRTQNMNKANLYHNWIEHLTSLPIKIIAYAAMHTFGIRLIYPGSIGLLQMMLEQSLQQGRSRMIEFHNGERFKLHTFDNNSIDVMFIDKRGNTMKGNTLVICSEGNAGFYEIGIMITSIEAGYSTLGWNHPGFGGSTGSPYPDQEQNGIDAVIQFAIKKLSFKIENIILFGWSIGGYTTSWAAMNYPEIKAVILDASFDDILPLAINHMPRWWESIVRVAIRQYANLNISEQLIKYPGPVLLFRRTEDEVICLRENDLSSNRGNHLLTKLLQNRYPYIYEHRQIEVLNQYFAATSSVAQDQIIQRHNVTEDICQTLLQTYLSECPKQYPMKIGEEFSNQDKNQLALYLARKHFMDFKASHCVNLPCEMFQLPWDINVESDFVFT